jgi:endonuclease-3 related protein
MTGVVRRRALARVREVMNDAYGPQDWWPGDSAFEIAAGAVLTQNTAWTNVEQALARLRTAGLLDPAAIVDLPLDALAQCIRPAGCFNVKARRLAALCRFWLDKGGERGLARLATGELRSALLAVHGVGPETADDILLYAFGRPVFVVDAYTRRLFGRLGLARGDEGYEALRRSVETAVGRDPGALNELHALIVRHGKQACRPRPLCPRCCLQPYCRTGR